MRWVATWLTACLATATFGQVHIIDRHDVTEPPVVTIIPVHPTLQINSSNPGHIPVKNENNLLNEVNPYVSSEDGSSSPEDSVNESSRSRISGEPASGENPSNEIPNPSNEIPELSNESPSNEIPSPSNESPEGSNEIPSPSNEVPSPSNEIPDGSSEIPSPSNEIPEGSNEIPSPSNEVPEVPGSSSGDSSSNKSDGEADDDLPEIETTLGPVKGVKWHNTDIIAYIDVPYGKTGTPFAVSIFYYLLLV